MPGKRINLSELADDPMLSVPEARRPSFAAAARSVRLEVVAPNPRNTRDFSRAEAKAKLDELKASIEANGQLSSCAVVTRGAFVAIFPEHAAAVANAEYVLVNGARRREVLRDLDIATIKIDIMDALAVSRQAFLLATAAENIDRVDFDPIEEALAVKQLVDECGSGQEAAAKLHRTAPWVTQRLNLLKLAPEVQELVRIGELPLREARTLHTLPPEQQLAEWMARTAAAATLTAVNQGDETDADEEPTRPRPGRPMSDSDGQGSKSRKPVTVASVVRQLGATPAEIATALRSVLPVDDLRELIRELTV